MEPLHDPNDRVSHNRTYTPKRSRWPGLLGAAAVVAAVLGVTMWAQHDDARKADAPPDKGAGVTAPAQPGTDPGGSPAPTAGDPSKVATQPPPARQ